MAGGIFSDLRDKRCDYFCSLEVNRGGSLQQHAWIVAGTAL